MFLSSSKKMDTPVNSGGQFPLKPPGTNKPSLGKRMRKATWSLGVEVLR